MPSWLFEFFPPWLPADESVFVAPFRLVGVAVAIDIVFFPFRSVFVVVPFVYHI